MLAGSALLLTGVEKRVAEGEGSDAKNIPTRIARGVGKGVLNVTYGLLFFAKGEAGPSGSYQEETENTIPYYPSLVFPPAGDGYNEKIDPNTDEYDTYLDDQ